MVATSYQVNYSSNANNLQVDKGSRQNGSVTSGKGLALRVGHVGPWVEAFGAGRH